MQTESDHHGLPPATDELSQIDAMMAADDVAGKSVPAVQSATATQPAALAQAPNQSTDDQSLPADVLDDAPAQPVQQGPGRPAKPARSFDGLDEREAAIFSKMANEGYEHLYPLYRRLKEAGGLDTLLKQKEDFEKQRGDLEKARFYDHPDAYKLSPEYAQQQQIVQNIDDIDQFWQEQLSLVHAGKPAQIIEHTADGKLRVSAQTYEPSPQLQTRILSELATIKADRNEAVARLGQIRESFKQQYVSYESEFGNVTKKLFGSVAEKLRDQVKKELELLPPYARHKPEAQFAAHALAFVRAVIAKQKASATQASADAAVKQIASSNGPTVDAIKTGGTKPNTASSDKQIEDEVRRMYA
jgi:hypothetical protein